MTCRHDQFDSAPPPLLAERPIPLVTMQAMSSKDPFDEILQPQPRSARHFRQDPFDDDDPFENAAQVENPAGGRPQAQGQNGYALDPFFDE